MPLLGLAKHGIRTLEVDLIPATIGRRADQEFIARLLRAARAVRDRVNPGRPLITRDFLAVLLGAGEAELSAVPELQSLQYDIGSLHRAFAEFLAQQREGESLAKWNEILQVPSDFDIVMRMIQARLDPAVR
jgi:hypothetical protein